MARRPLRRAALGALATAAVLHGLDARSAFVGASGAVTRNPLTRVNAGKGVVTPVVDEIDLEDAPEAPKKSKKEKESFDSLMKAADAFAAKKEKAKKKSVDSIEDDLKGLSLEDDSDLSATMMARARTGKTDISLQGRLGKWATESVELITNPTPIQLTYVTIFVGTVIAVILAGILTLALGGLRLRGENEDVERRRAITMRDPYLIRRAQMEDYKSRAFTVKNLKDLPYYPEQANQ